MKNIVHSLFAFLILATASLGAGSSAYAAGGGDEAGGGGSNRTVDLSNIVVPVERDGQLINYLFVSSVVTVASGYDHWGARDTAHIIRDHILREAHRNPVGLAGHPMELDEDKFRAVIITVFDELMGEGAVESIEILSSDSQLVFVEG